MPPAVVALIVLSAFLHALWNAALKRQADPEGASVAILGVAAVTSAAAWALGGGPAFTRAGAAWTALAGLCEGGYFVTLALAFRHASLGVVYPIARGGALVAVWPASVLWLGERLGARSAGGAALVTAGLVLVGLERGARAAPRGVLWAVACALFVAGYHLGFKQALDTGATPGAVFAVALAIALPLNLARLGRDGSRRARAAARGRPLAIGAAGAVCTASFLLFLSALARGGAGAALTLRNTSVVFALLLAWAIGERPGGRQIAGTLAVAIGAVLLGWPP